MENTPKKLVSKTGESSLSTEMQIKRTFAQMLIGSLTANDLRYIADDMDNPCIGSNLEATIAGMMKN